MIALRFVALAGCVWLLHAPALANDRKYPDRVSFGGDVVVEVHETVGDVVTMGGDALVRGRVTGDVVTMGGDALVHGSVDGEVVTMGGSARLRPGAVVAGDLVTMGGVVDMAEGAAAHGDLVESGKWLAGAGNAARAAAAHHHQSDDSLASVVGDFFSDLVSYGLLFVLGLLFYGLARDRFQSLQCVLVREPLRAGGLGLMGLVGAVVAAIALCVTIIGIPAGVLLLLAIPIAAYVGLTVAASVVGAALPIARLRERPIAQLGAGVAALFLVSQIPVIGPVLTAVAAAGGIGSIVITRLASTPPPEKSTPVGPYRTSATA